MLQIAIKLLDLEIPATGDDKDELDDGEIE